MVNNSMSSVAANGAVPNQSNKTAAARKPVSQEVPPEFHVVDGERVCFSYMLGSCRKGGVDALRCAKGAHPSLARYPDHHIAWQEARRRVRGDTAGGSGGGGNGRGSRGSRRNRKLSRQQQARAVFYHGMPGRDQQQQRAPNLNQNRNVHNFRNNNMHNAGGGGILLNGGNSNNNNNNNNNNNVNKNITMFNNNVNIHKMGGRRPGPAIYHGGHHLHQQQQQHLQQQHLQHHQQQQQQHHRRHAHHQQQQPRVLPGPSPSGVGSVSGTHYNAHTPNNPLNRPSVLPFPSRPTPPPPPGMMARMQGVSLAYAMHGQQQQQQQQQQQGHNMEPASRVVPSSSQPWMYNTGSGGQSRTQLPAGVVNHIIRPLRAVSAPNTMQQQRQQQQQQQQAVVMQALPTAAVGGQQVMTNHIRQSSMANMMTRGAMSGGGGHLQHEQVRAAVSSSAAAAGGGNIRSESQEYNNRTIGNSAADNTASVGMNGGSQYVAPYPQATSQGPPPTQQRQQQLAHHSTYANIPSSMPGLKYNTAGTPAAGAYLVSSPPPPPPPPKAVELNQGNQQGVMNNNSNNHDNYTRRGMQRPTLQQQQQMQVERPQETSSTSMHSGAVNGYRLERTYSGKDLLLSAYNENTSTTATTTTSSAATSSDNNDNNSSTNRRQKSDSVNSASSVTSAGAALRLSAAASSWSPRSNGRRSRGSSLGIEVEQHPSAASALRSSSSPSRLKPATMGAVVSKRRGTPPIAPLLIPAAARVRANSIGMNSVGAKSSPRTSPLLSPRPCMSPSRMIPLMKKLDLDSDRQQQQQRQKGTPRGGGKEEHKEEHKDEPLGMTTTAATTTTTASPRGVVARNSPKTRIGGVGGGGGYRRPFSLSLSTLSDDENEYSDGEEEEEDSSVDESDGGDDGDDEKFTKSGGGGGDGGKQCVMEPRRDDRKKKKKKKRAGRSGGTSGNVSSSGGITSMSGHSIRKIGRMLRTRQLSAAGRELFDVAAKGAKSGNIDALFSTSSLLNHLDHHNMERTENSSTIDLSPTTAITATTATARAATAAATTNIATTTSRQKSPTGMSPSRASTLIPVATQSFSSSNFTDTTSATAAAVDSYSSFSTSNHNHQQKQLMSNGHYPTQLPTNHIAPEHNIGTMSDGGALLNGVSQNTSLNEFGDMSMGGMTSDSWSETPSEASSSDVAGLLPPSVTTNISHPQVAKYPRLFQRFFDETPRGQDGQRYHTPFTFN